MHISEGVLSAPVLLAGAAVTLGGTGIGLMKMDYDQIPKTAMLAAAFFVASFVHVPIGPSSVHLILNGLVGLLLGWAAFPAILIGLALQGILFQYGGLTCLGVNTATMALPAVASYYLLGPLVRGEKVKTATVAGFLAGALSVALSGLLVGAALICTGESFFSAAVGLLVAHLPVMAVEGVITAACVIFLKQVKPELLHAAYVS